MIINFILIISTSVFYANRYYDEDFDEYGSGSSGGLALFIIIFLYFWLGDKILNFLEPVFIKGKK